MPASLSPSSRVDRTNSHIMAREALKLSTKLVEETMVRKYEQASRDMQLYERQTLLSKRFGTSGPDTVTSPVRAPPLM